jgi:hypothetical protein
MFLLWKITVFGTEWRFIRIGWTVLMTLLIALSPAAFSTSTYAVTFSVTSTADSGTGSLRQAITDAVAGDVITFNLSGCPCTITLTSGELVINKDLTIDGSGQSITVSGDNATRVMQVSEGSTLILNALTIADATTGGGIGGGGILNAGTLNVSNSTFSNNRSDYGGGIANVGTMTISNSTFSNNRSSASQGGGGAIYTSYLGPLTVKNSTFSDNRAINFGAGIYSSGPLTVSNSTFSNNRAINFGGGIYISSPLTVNSSTFSNNDAFEGGGIYVNGKLHLRNTIIANSLTGADCVTNGKPAININNLIEDGSCSPAITGDPNLGPLQLNAPGNTETHALLSGSMAIDAGDTTTCAAMPVNNLDQRGITRPQGDQCDIGAFEFQDTTPPAVTINQAAGQADPTNSTPINFTVVFTELVTGFTVDDVTLSGTAGGTQVDSVIGSGTTYNVAVSSIVSDGTVIANIPAGAVTDAAGNGNDASTTTDNIITYDSTAPSVVLNSAAPNPTNSSPILVTVTFNETVTGFTANDITTGNGTVSNFAGSKANYTFDLVPSGQGIVTADIDAGMTKDIAENPNRAATQFSRTYSSIVPTRVPPELESQVIFLPLVTH